jgi:hypothetical protein
MSGAVRVDHREDGIIDELERRSAEMVRSHAPVDELASIRAEVARLRECKRQQRKIAICDGCGLRWNVSSMRDVSRVYICPQCERRLNGRDRGGTDVLGTY